MILLALHATVGALGATSPKRGTSGLAGCRDADALGLSRSWTYNWGLFPSHYEASSMTIAADPRAAAAHLAELGNSPPARPASLCNPLQTQEFVPMFWGCWTNCTSQLWPEFKADWAAAGVKAILGFNEPDNPTQSNLDPAQAASYWGQLDELAQSFDPPLTVVGPGMTHWDADGGSLWLDQFFSNLSGSVANRITFLAQHDYSGNATGIVARADAAYKKYGRKVWITEFSVGSGKGRAENDAFMRQVLRLLDSAESVDRYAWYSTRNAPAAWVNESSLLPWAAGDWSKRSGATCDQDQMLWLSQGDIYTVCEARAMANSGCASPKRVISQSGSPENCYCANTTACNVSRSSWQDLYEFTGTAPPAPWNHTSGTACAGDQMLWLGQHGALSICEAQAVGTAACTETPTKVVLYQTGDVKNCYCLNTTSCTRTPSTWLDLHAQPVPPPLPLTPTSTGALYMGSSSAD